MSRALDVAVMGVGMWAEGVPNWPAARELLCSSVPWPAPGSAVGLPPIGLLAPAERRRASASVRVAICVAEEACAHAGVDPSGLLSVFTSTHGELGLTDEICRTLAQHPEALSPTRFHNSVHNAASGYWTIGAGCAEASTAISAWRGSFAAGLLEAGVQAECEQRPVLLVAFDAAAAGPLASMAVSGSLLGVALVLAPAGMAADDVLRLRLCLHPDRAADPVALPVVIDNPLAACLPLFAALARGTGADLRFDLGPRTQLAVALRAAGG